MTSRMRLAGLIVTTGALVALPLVGAAPALAHKHHHHSKGSSGDKPSSVAYPKAPGNTPAAGDNGKPVVPKGDAGAKPEPAGKASTEGAKTSTGTPAAAYPGAPTNQPAAEGKKP